MPSAVVHWSIIRIAVVQALVRSGFEPDAIRTLFRVHAIGGKYREKGRFGDRYLALTITRARNWTRAERRR